MSVGESSIRNHRLLGRGRIRIAVIVVSLAAVGLGSALAVNQLTGSSSDPGIALAEKAGLAQPVSAEQTHNGVTVRVSGIVADDTQTALFMEFRGRDSTGDAATASSRPVIVDSSGREYLATQLSAVDESDPRRQTWLFPPLDPAAKQLELKFAGVTINDRSGPVRGDPSRMTHIEGAWSIRLDWDGERHAARVVQAKATEALGAGSISVDSVAFAPTGVVVSGHLAGFDVDSIPSILLETTLTTADGQVLRPIYGRSGFGEQRERFEFRFATEGAGKSKFEVGLKQGGESRGTAQLDLPGAD